MKKLLIGFALTLLMGASFGQQRQTVVEGAASIKGCDAGLINIGGIFVCSANYHTGVPPAIVDANVPWCWWQIPSFENGYGSCVVPAPDLTMGVGGGNSSSGVNLGCGACTGTVTDGSGNAITSGDGSSYSTSGSSSGP
jgi:hypothetical protein